MILFLLFFQLLFALATYHIFELNKKQDILLVCLIEPLLIAVFYVLIVSSIFFAVDESHSIFYYLGYHTLAGIVFSALTGVLLYVALMRRLRNAETTTFVVVLYVLLSLSFIGGIAETFYIANKYKTAQEEQQSDEEDEERTFTFEGISFTYPAGWWVDSDFVEEEDGYSHQQATVEKEGTREAQIATITGFEQDADIELLIAGQIDALKNEKTHRRAKFSSVEDGVFAYYPCRKVTYKGRYLGDRYVGYIIGVEIGGRKLLILLQAGSEDSLNSDFKFIEESLTITTELNNDVQVYEEDFLLDEE